MQSTNINFITVINQSNIMMLFAALWLSGIKVDTV